MTNPNIPPEIADDLLSRAKRVVDSAEWISPSFVCSLGAMDGLKSSVQRAIAASNDATPAPAPVRISPEVRETILTALSKCSWMFIDSIPRKAAIAFVEALP